MSRLTLATWKAEPREFGKIEHGYSLVSDYYVRKHINGIALYKITLKGRWKIKENRLNVETHNFLIYLQGYGEFKPSKQEIYNESVNS